MKTAIVTDSVADLPPELAAEHRIQVVPAIVVLEGRGYQDGIELSREEFYIRQPHLKQQPTTAAPAVGAFQSIFETLLSTGYDQVLTITTTSKLSGIFNAARLAAEAFTGRVSIEDSQQLSMGIGFQVLAAAEAAVQGAPLDTIKARVAAVRVAIKVTAMLDTLEYVRRSGRVSWAAASLGSFLRIKPFIGIKDGLVVSMGQTRSRNKGINRLKERMATLGPLQRLAVLHTNTLEEARSFLSEAAGVSKTPPLLVNVGPALGVHIGPNGLGFAAVPVKA